MRGERFGSNQLPWDRSTGTEFYELVKRVVRPEDGGGG